jgi:hypothetical protein
VSSSQAGFCLPMTVHLWYGNESARACGKLNYGRGATVSRRSDIGRIGGMPLEVGVPAVGRWFARKLEKECADFGVVAAPGFWKDDSALPDAGSLLGFAAVNYPESSPPIRGGCLAVQFCKPSIPLTRQISQVVSVFQRQPNQNFTFDRRRRAAGGVTHGPPRRIGADVVACRHSVCGHREWLPTSLRSRIFFLCRLAHGKR